MGIDYDPQDFGNTDFNYFCSLLIDDLLDRFDQDAQSDAEKNLCQKLIGTIRDAQEFKGCDAPADELALMQEIKSFSPPPPPQRKSILHQIQITVSPYCMLMLRKIFAIAVLVFICGAVMAQRNLPKDLDGSGKEYLPLYLKKNEAKLQIRYPHRDTTIIHFRESCNPTIVWKGFKIVKHLSSSASQTRVYFSNWAALDPECKIVEILR